MAYYLQVKREANNIETLGEFTDSKEAYRVAREYGLKDPTARYYIAKKPCKGWAEK